MHQAYCLLGEWILSLHTSVYVCVYARARARTAIVSEIGVNKGNENSSKNYLPVYTH